MTEVNSDVIVKNSDNLEDENNPIDLEWEIRRLNAKFAPNDNNEIFSHEYTLNMMNELEHSDIFNIDHNKKGGSYVNEVVLKLVNIDDEDR